MAMRSVLTQIKDVLDDMGVYQAFRQYIFLPACVFLSASIISIFTSMMYAPSQSANAAAGDCAAITTPCIETVTPSQGPIAGGTTVTINGTNLAQLPMPMFTQITSGYETTCGIASDDFTYCWGRGANGRLGNGGTNDSSTPVRVSNGDTTDGKFTQISGGHFATCGISAADGWVYCWGEGSWGALGSAGGDATTPRAINRGQIPNGVTATKLVVGEAQAHIIGSNGWVYGWGYNDPRLGDASTTQRNTPVRLAQGALPGSEGDVTFIDVTSGYQHGCGIINTGAAYCWGNGGSGRLGNGSSNNQNSPVAVSGGLTFSQISAGTYSTCAVSTTGQAYCWGLGDGGRLGTGNTTDRNTPTAIAQGAIPAGVNISQVSVSTLDAGGNASCVIAGNDKAYCWGYGDVGELGDGGTGTSSSPVAVTQGAMPSGYTFKEISSGADHVCAIGGDSLAYCWGYSTYGRLGNGNASTNQSSPVKVLKATNMDTYAPYTITIGGVECTNPIITSTYITCVTSAHQAGAVEVLINNSVDSASRSNAFNYTLPLGSYSIVPDKGSTAGGAQVNIYGSNFKTVYQPTTGLVFPGGGTGQYIDTGIDQLGNNKKVELQFQLDANAVASTSTNRIFGAFGSDWTNNSYALSKLSNSESGGAGNNQFVVRVGGDPIQPQGNSNGTIFLGTKDTNIHTWIQDNKTVYWDNPSTPRTTLSDSNLSSSNGNTMYIGNIHYNGGLASSGIGGQPFSGTVYYLKIWSGGTLVRNFIPVKRNVDGACGLYDQLNNVFYGNLGTGTLTCTVDAGAAPITPSGTTTVLFDGLPATNVVVSSDGTMITTNTPAHLVGTVDVVVTVDGVPIMLSDAYNYVPTVSSVTPNYGPLTGGTGFGTSYNSNGTITINGNGFIADKYGISQSYVTQNAQNNWTNPAFTSATNSSAFGGTISMVAGSGSVYGDRAPYRIFDRNTSCTNATNWQQQNVSGTNPFLITYNLPNGKYVNLQSIQVTNGYYAPVGAIEFFAGANASGLALTGSMSIPGPYTGGDGDMCKPLTISQADIQDVWTNKITIRVYPPTMRSGYGTWLALTEAILNGRSLDLSGLSLTNLPTYFTMSDLTVPASAVKVGGNNCVSFTVVSDAQITCIPPAGSAGTVDITVTVNGITSTYAVNTTDDDYTYTSPPTVTAVTPDHGLDTGGSNVTITGTNFVSYGSSVTFDIAGTAATCDNVTVVNSTTITCVTTAHNAELVSVTVSSPTGDFTLADAYTYTDLTLSLSSSVVSVSVDPSQSGGTGYSSVDVGVKTNHPNGYALTIRADSHIDATTPGFGNVGDDNLVCNTNPDHKYTPITSDGALSVNTWGWNVGPSQPTSWLKMGTTDRDIIVPTAGPSINNGTNYDIYKLWFGAKADYSQPACTYSGRMIITASVGL